MTQCFSVHSVTASTKGPGPPRYKSQNQWSFGKTDGKPLADRCAERRAEESGEGESASKHHPHQRQRSSDEPLQPGRYQPRFSETIPDQGESQKITNTSAANERDNGGGETALHSLRPQFAF